MKDSDDIQGLGFKGILQGGVGRVGCGEKGVFGFRRVGGLDPDAAAYIGLVEAEGVAVSGDQKSALDTFIRAEKAGARWDLHKRLYLPIWGQAAANAICMRSLTSGTFVGGVTYDAEGIRSDGTTGYFNIGVSPGGAGCELNSAMITALVWHPTNTALASSDRYGGAQETNGNTRMQLGSVGSGAHGGLGPNTFVAMSASAGGDFRGILTLSRDSAASRFVGFRNASGWSIVVSDTEAAVLLNTTQNITFLAVNSNGTIGTFLRNTMALGAGGIGLGMVQAAAEDFSANLKTLWETCTGLTLP